MENAKNLLVFGKTAAVYLYFYKILIFETLATFLEPTIKLITKMFDYY